MTQGAPVYIDSSQARKATMTQPKPVPITHERIEHDFTYHPPEPVAQSLLASGSVQQRLHEAVRAQCRDLAHWLVSNLPAGREASLAVTALEEVMFWGNAAVARWTVPGVVGDGD